MWGAGSTRLQYIASRLSTRSEGYFKWERGITVASRLSTRSEGYFKCERGITVASRLSTRSEGYFKWERGITVLSNGADVEARNIITARGLTDITGTE